MAIYLGALLFAFILTSIAIVPFIDFLYKIHFLNTKGKFKKTNIPTGGGILVVFFVTVFFALLFPLLQRFGIYITSAFPIKPELNIIFFTFISFGLLGFYGDIIDIFHYRTRNRFQRYLFSRATLQLVLSVIIALLLYLNLSISIINFPLFGALEIGAYYVPIAAFIIFLFSQSFRLTDRLDGLSSGVFLISLMTLWAISFSIMDTVLSTFIALWLGCLLAFLYFNVYPARVTLGLTGSLSFGATFAVTGLLLGKVFALFFIGFIFILETVVFLSSSFYKNVYPRKEIFFNNLSQLLVLHGWPEPKVAMRYWLAAIMLSLIGLWFALG